MSDYQDGALTREEKNYAMLAHLLALAVFILPSFGNIIGPLIIWLIKKDESAFVDKNGKESLNFQISVTIYMIAAVILTVLSLGILFLLPVAVSIVWLVYVVIATVKVSNGEDYSYPLTIRFIK
ncbi:MAG TPA: DUF4870 domain-containing protein [Bacillota bacterium]|jgi:uncharacterized Tic20 family protein|nr:DUF4870 domain-containing protein [Bacillota bacterium]HOA36504.1 DUF4870 domain-containing protein [Bacillota bacterium]HPZ12531.1 DUF4870 domain-containing protein [Bacillota bacterium]HQE10870.1 DUF4870 domain-containing protein [Bacillota bacterium]